MMDFQQWFKWYFSERFNPEREILEVMLEHAFMAGEIRAKMQAEEAEAKP